MAEWIVYWTPSASSKLFLAVITIFQSTINIYNLVFLNMNCEDSEKQKWENETFLEILRRK